MPGRQGRGQRGDRGGRGGGRRAGRPERPQEAERPQRPGRGAGEPAGPRVKVGSTGNSPELVETIPIVAEAGRGRRVVLSFGPDSKTDSPLPDIKAGDRLEVYAELEVTTDAEDANHPGRIGNAYGYAPELEASLLLAADAEVTEEKRSRSIALARPWRGSVSHRLHHAVITFADAGLEVPAEGLPWQGPSSINLVLSANSPEAQQGDVLLIGQNEKTPVVVQDMAGIRVVRHSAAERDAAAPVRETACLVNAVPVAKQATVVLSHRLDGLAEGEQLLVKAGLVTDAARLGYPARISTRVFLADSPDQSEPGGAAKEAATWNGHVSKITDFNCLPELGPQLSQKFGVLAIRRAPAGPLYLNLIAISAAPFGGAKAGDTLPIDAASSFLEVTRYPAALAG